MSDVSQHMLFFTDEEPAQESLGTRRHYFGRPSLKGYKQNPFRSQSPGPLKDEVVLQSPEAASVLRRIAEQDQRGELEQRFR